MLNHACSTLVIFNSKLCVDCILLRDSSESGSDRESLDIRGVSVGERGTHGPGTRSRHAHGS